MSHYESFFSEWGDIRHSILRVWSHLSFWNPRSRLLNRLPNWKMVFVVIEIWFTISWWLYANWLHLGKLWFNFSKLDFGDSLNQFYIVGIRLSILIFSLSLIHKKRDWIKVQRLSPSRLNESATKCHMQALYFHLIRMSSIKPKISTQGMSL